MKKIERLTRSEAFMYHASNQCFLKTLIPAKSTHGNAYVYATPSAALSALFLSGKGGDFTCAIGIDMETGLPYICERFEGALNYRYKGVAGAVYKLDAASFHSGCTPWDAEWVSSEPVAVLEELAVPDAYELLRVFEQRGHLKIVRYPETIGHVKRDKTDLVESAVYFHRLLGDSVLKQVEQYHPEIIGRIKAAIDEEKLYDSQSM